MYIPTANMMCSILNDSILHDSILVTPVCDVDAQEFRKPGDSSVEFLSVFLSTSVLCKCSIFLETIVEHVSLNKCDYNNCCPYYGTYPVQVTSERAAV